MQKGIKLKGKKVTEEAHYRGRRSTVPIPKSVNRKKTLSRDQLSAIVLLVVLTVSTVIASSGFIVGIYFIAQEFITPDTSRGSGAIVGIFVIFITAIIVAILISFIVLLYNAIVQRYSTQVRHISLIILSLSIIALIYNLLFLADISFNSLLGGGIFIAIFMYFSSSVWTFIVYRSP